MTLAKPTAKERVSYGWIVICQAFGVLRARLRQRPQLVRRADRAQPASVMFSSALPPPSFTPGSPRATANPKVARRRFCSRRRRSGAPIVTTRHADIPPVVSEGPGVCLRAEHDTEGLGRAPVWALQHRTPSSAALAIAHHDVTSVVARLEDIYKGVAEGAAVASAAP